MGVKGQIDGLDLVLHRLQLLQGKEVKKVVSASLRKGANIIKKAASDKARAFDDPSTPSQIWKEIVVRTGKSRIPDAVRIRVGVKGGAMAYVNNSKNRKAGRVGKSYEGGGNVYWWRFLEFGTSNMAARPFMRPAMAENMDKVTANFSSNVSQQIDKLLAKKLAAGL